WSACSAAPAASSGCWPAGCWPAGWWSACLPCIAPWRQAPPRWPRRRRGRPARSTCSACCLLLGECQGELWLSCAIAPLQNGEDRRHVKGAEEVISALRVVVRGGGRGALGAGGRRVGARGARRMPAARAGRRPDAEIHALNGHVARGDQ